MRRILSLALAFLASCLLPSCGGAGGGGGGGGAPTEITFVHVATAANRFVGGGGSLSWTEIDHAAVNLNPAAKLIVTPWRTGGSAANPSPVTVTYDPLSGRWSIFNDSVILLPIGAAFTVTVASDAFVHVSTLGGGINAATSEIAHPLLDNQPNAVFFITRNSNPIGVPNVGGLVQMSFGTIYYPPVGALPGRWAIQSEDATFPIVDMAWNVLVRSNVSPAVRHTALPANTGPGAGIGLFASETQTIFLNSPLGMHILHVRLFPGMSVPLLTPPGAVAGGVLMNVFHQDGSAVPIGEQFLVWRP